MHQGNHPVPRHMLIIPSKSTISWAHLNIWPYKSHFFFITRVVLFSRFEVGIDFPPWPFMGTKAHASNWSSRWWETWETVDPKTEENTEKVLKDQNSGHTLEDTTTLYLYFVVQTDNNEQSDTLDITHYPTHYLFVGVDDVD